MIKRNLGYIPEGINYPGEASELNNTEFKILIEENIDIAIYWYSRGAYEGMGQLLYHTPNGWNLYALDHQSCHGPVDGIDGRNGMLLNELHKKCSKDLLKQVQPLFDIGIKLEKG